VVLNRKRRLTSGTPRFANETLTSPKINCQNGRVQGEPYARNSVRLVPAHGLIEPSKPEPRRQRHRNPRRLRLLNEANRRLDPDSQARMVLRLEARGMDAEKQRLVRVESRVIGKQ
jgi:hypothetical protein